MVDHKQHKNEKVEKQNGVHGSDKKDQRKDHDASVVAKKNPTSAKNDDEDMAQGNKQQTAQKSQKPAGGQEGMRSKAKTHKEEDSKSKSTQTSNR